jgi:hypothetical protein
MNEQDGEPRFDPRHDPIYQRGYHEGASAPESARADIAQPVVVRKADVPVRAPSQQQPAPVRSTPPRASAEMRPSPTEQPDETGALLVPGAGEEVPQPEAQRNPYFVALWIIAPVLVVAGIGLEWRSVALADYGYASSPGDVPLEAIIQQLTWVVAPIMITVGLLTMVALLFWRAVHWRSAGQEPGQPRTGFRRLGPWS